VTCASSISADSNTYLLQPYNDHLCHAPHLSPPNSLVLLLRVRGTIRFVLYISILSLPQNFGLIVVGVTLLHYRFVASTRPLPPKQSLPSLNTAYLWSHLSLTLHTQSPNHPVTIWPRHRILLPTLQTPLTFQLSDTIHPLHLRLIIPQALPGSLVQPTPRIIITTVGTAGIRVIITIVTAAHSAPRATQAGEHAP
jgi:hypothetical protein